MTQLTAYDYAIQYPSTCTTPEEATSCPRCKAYARYDEKWMVEYAEGKIERTPDNQTKFQILMESL